MIPRRFNWNTQHKNKLELNTEIITPTQDIQDVWNFRLFRMVFYDWNSFLNSNINLQNTGNLSLSNHIPKISFISAKS